jgi:hypothetical protein
VREATTQFIPTNAAPLPMRPRVAAEVPIVSTAPQRPFVEVGFIEGYAENVWDEHANVLARMRATAGRLGCDVLLITGPNNHVSGFKGSTGTEMGYHGACLVYGEAPPPPPAPQAAAPRPPPTPAAPAGLLYRNQEGNVFRVQPDAKAEALRAGWVPVEQEGRAR